MLTRTRKTFADVLAQADSCRGLKDKIRQHGNWFTQLTLPGYHLNFWGHPTIQMPQIRTNPHTHDYAFTSTILLGEITNVLVDAEEDANGHFLLHTVQAADNGRDVVFNTTDRHFHAFEASRRTMTPGDDYDMDLNVYHYTQCYVPTITYLKLWDVPPCDYNVLLPNGAGLNAKTAMRYVREDELPDLWSRIDAMLARVTLTDFVSAD